MEQNYRITGEELLYQMPKEVDHHCAKRISREMDSLIEAFQIKKLILDFEDTVFMDSSGIGVVAGRSRILGYFDGKLYFQNLSGRVERIFRAAGLYQLAQERERTSTKMQNGKVEV